jgi:putative membrane protein
MLIARRSLLLGATAIIPAAYALPAFALDALPDSRFVGYVQQVNDFEIASGKLALAKSMNGGIRDFATRMIADHTNAAEELAKARSEAGVSFAPDPNGPPHTMPILQQLSQLDGPDFDAAYTSAQVRVLDGAEQQFAANSHTQGNSSGPAFTGIVMRFAERELPHIQRHLEMARGLAAATH